MTNLLKVETLREAGKVFLVSRLLILLIIIFSSQLTTVTSDSNSETIHHPQIELHFGSIKKALKRVFYSADARWYISIAKRGYDRESPSAVGPRNWVFFPLFPLLLSFFSKGDPSYVLVGLSISNIAFFISLVLLYEVAVQFGYSTRVAKEALWLIAFFPMSYFFSVPYTESLFLMLVLGSFYFLHQGKLVLSGVFFGLATATRPIGLMMLPGYLLYLHTKQILFTIRGLFVASCSVLGLLLFMLYLYHITGDPMAFSTAQRAWGRGENSFLFLLRYLFQHPGQMMADWNFIFLHLLLVILAIYGTMKLLLQKRYHLALLVLIPVGVSLSTGTLLSVGRFVMVLFPLYFVLAEERDDIRKVIFILFVSFLTIMTALYGAMVTSAMA